MRLTGVFALTSPARPPALALATFFNDVAKGGPSAAERVRKGLRRLPTHLGLTGLPLQSPLLHGILVVRPPAVTEQANELPFKAWAHLITLTYKAKGTFQLIAPLAL